MWGVMNNLSPNKQQHSKLKIDSGKLCSESLQSWLPAANSTYRVECLLPAQNTELIACCQLKIQSWLLAASSKYSWLLAGSSDYSWLLAASSDYRADCLLPTQPTELIACCQLKLQSWLLAVNSAYKVDCLLPTLELGACFRKPSRRAGDHQQPRVWLLPHQVWAQGLRFRRRLQQHVLCLRARFQDTVLAAGK